MDILFSGAEIATEKQRAVVEQDARYGARLEQDAGSLVAGSLVQ